MGRDPTLPVLNRQESGGSTETTSTGQGSSTTSFSSQPPSPVRQISPYKALTPPTTSHIENSVVKRPAIVPRQPSTASSADTLTEEPSDEHPHLPKRKSFTRRQTLAEMMPGHVEDAHYVSRLPSRAMYMKRKASMLMIWLPLAVSFSRSRRAFLLLTGDGTD